MEYIIILQSLSNTLYLYQAHPYLEPDKQCTVVFTGSLDECVKQLHNLNSIYKLNTSTTYFLNKEEAM